MLKVLTHTRSDTQILILGFTDVNIERMRNDEPILVRLEELGLGGGSLQILCTVGESEKLIMAGLEKVGLVPDGMTDELPDTMLPGQVVEKDFRTS